MRSLRTTNISLGFDLDEAGREKRPGAPKPDTAQPVGDQPARTERSQAPRCTTGRVDQKRRIDGVLDAIREHRHPPTVRDPLDLTKTRGRNQRGASRHGLGAQLPLEPGSVDLPAVAVGIEKAIAIGGHRTPPGATEAVSREMASGEEGRPQAHIGEQAPCRTGQRLSDPTRRFAILVDDRQPA